MDKTLDLVESLSEIAAASGSEQGLAAFIRAQLPAYRHRSDSMGNLYCEAERGSATKILLSAHMDEVGLMVQAIRPDGFLRITSLGGWQPDSLAGQRLRVVAQGDNEVLGIVSCLPPHHSSSDTQPKAGIASMYVDIGAKDEHEVAAMGVRIGDSVVPDSAFTALGTEGKLFVGKAFDNRLGVALALELLQSLEPEHKQLYGFFSAQEELGARGARAYNGQRSFDLAIVLEASPADDQPQVPADERQCSLRAGPQIRCYDPGFSANRDLLRTIVDLAQSQGLPHQLAVRRSGGTDASNLQYALQAPIVVIAVPTRYIHSHNAVFHLDDYFATRSLVAEIIQAL